MPRHLETPLETKVKRKILIAKPARKIKKINGLSIIRNTKKLAEVIDTGLEVKMNASDLLPCRVECIEDVNELGRKYRGRLNLNLTFKREKKNMQAIDPELNLRLQIWENSINAVWREDPYISVENFVDNEGPPEDFQYVRQNITTSQKAAEMLDPQFLVGCSCQPRCVPSSCSCPTDSGGKFAYDRRKRVLLPAGSPIYECNRNCKCFYDCPNRVIQKGQTARVCIFRTSNGRGWGLKAKEFIHSGKFVIEYVGEIITSEEAELRGSSYDARQQTYLFDLDFYERDNMFTIDAYKYGNASHFINHSCDPNLQVYSVWVDTLDPRLPRIGLFATRDIYTDEELTFDYMMSFDQNDNSTISTPGAKAASPVVSPSKYGSKNLKENDTPRNFCACGAKNCRKFYI